MSFTQLPFNHPLYLMFSSGTTGPPKCMVHSAGVSEVFISTDNIVDKILGLGWSFFSFFGFGYPDPKSEKFDHVT